MTGAIQFLIKLSVSADKRDAWKTLMHEMLAATEKEPGTLVYEWYVDDATGRFQLHERYADRAACENHIDNFVTNFAERFLGIASDIEFTVCGDPSEKVREVLAGLAPSYFALTAGFARFDRA